MAGSAMRVATPTGLASAAAGAAAAYLLDPAAGRGRRARLADRARGLPRRGARRTEALARKKVERARDRATGLAHELARDEEDLVPENEPTLVDKIRSEILGQERWQPHTINVDAAAGDVALRGQLDRPDQIEELVRRVREVPGVESVANYLHLPGTPPPNVEEARRAGSRPS